MTKSNETDLLAEMRKLRARLRRMSTSEAKWVGEDISHHQGMRKGMHIAYNHAASKLDQIIQKATRPLPVFHPQCEELVSPSRLGSGPHGRLEV